MTSIKKMDWDPAFSVDIAEIDACQKKMFDLFNELVELKNAQADAKDCINLISGLNEFSRLYFGKEERYLKKKGYPDFGKHGRAHRQFTKRFISLRRELTEDIANLSDEIISELRDWYVDHIRQMDQEYVPFVRTQNYIEKANLPRR